MNLAWQHVMVGSLSSWLPGDDRGFRNRNHRIHSTGDYKNRPPSREHQGLRAYHKGRSSAPVNFDVNIRILIIDEFVKKMRSLNLRIIACAAAKRHLHALAELPNNYEEMKRAIGKCKQKSSHAVRDLLPGQIWAAGAEFERIKDARHLHNTYDYIRFKQEPGAVVWSHNPNENWIDDPTVGVILMARARKHLRIYQTLPDAGV